MSRSSPLGARPNSYFVSTRMSPCAAQRFTPSAKSASDISDTARMSASEITPRATSAAADTDSSWPPLGALVLGVTMGAGSGSFCAAPGSAWPQKVRSPRA